jgi:hypothetical protein
MPSTFSPNLRIELIGDGEQAGSWGNTTNTNLGTVLEQAVSGYGTVSVTSANQAFTHANGTADQARNAMIELTTTTGADFAVYAPPTPKTYIIYNASAYVATIYNSTVLGNTTAAGTGVAIPAGGSVAVFTDGDDFSAALPPIATTLQAQTGTNNTAVLTALRMREGFNAAGTAPVYACRAWVNFDGTTPNPSTIRSSGNVTSITKFETGTYGINFTTAMQDANYAAVAVASGTGGAAFRIVTVSQYGTTACVLRSADVPSAAGIYPVPQDAETLSLAVFR